MNPHRRFRRLTEVIGPYVGLICLLLAQAVACSAEELSVSAVQQARLGIRVAPVRVGEQLDIANLSAEVQFPIAGTAAVVAPYAGRVLRVDVDEGDAVTQGEILAAVSSRDYATDHALLHRRRAEAEVARRQAARDEALLEAGVIPQARAETSRSSAMAQQAELESLESSVGDFHVDGGDATGFKLRAPITGFVVSRRIETSASIGAQEVAFVIARDSRWRLEVDAPVAVTAQLATEARLAVGAIEVPVEGRGTTLDPATQTIKLRGTLPADSGLLPGQRTTVTLRLPAPPDSLQLPRSALSRTGARAEVFVATPDKDGNLFRRVEVEVLAETKDFAVVAGALAADDQVAVSGVSALKGMGGS